MLLGKCPIPWKTSTLVWGVFKRSWIVFGIAFIIEKIWKIATTYFQARSVFGYSKMRENIADTVDIAPIGIGYGIRNAFFFFFFFQYTSLSKTFCQISVKFRHARVQFYLRRVHSFCSVLVRFHGNGKARYASIKSLILPFFHDRRHCCTL